ncbi:hint-domain-containing protein [Xylariaceae sp. FL0594]|nr:hint-domain-containing protein [Xylariaceae sp. FL0594]
MVVRPSQPSSQAQGRLVARGEDERVNREWCLPFLPNFCRVAWRRPTKRRTPEANDDNDDGEPLLARRRLHEDNDAFPTEERCPGHNDDNDDVECPPSCASRDSLDRDSWDQLSSTATLRPETPSSTEEYCYEYNDDNDDVAPPPSYARRESLDRDGWDQLSSTGTLHPEKPCTTEACCHEYNDDNGNGTSIVHAVARLQTTYATKCILTVTPPQGVALKWATKSIHAKKPGKPGEVLTLDLGNLQYGQSRTVFIEYDSADLLPGKRREITAQLNYMTFMGCTSGEALVTSPWREAGGVTTLSESLIAYHTTRHQLCQLLSLDVAPIRHGMKGYRSGNASLEEMNNMLQELSRNASSRKYDDEQNESLMDILKDQAKIAISSEYYWKRWGRHYYLSQWDAHEKSRICFAASSEVLLADNKKAPISELREGTAVETPSGTRHVQAVIKSPVIDTTMYRVREAVATPWHPIRLQESGKWYHPASLKQEDTVETVETVQYTGEVYSVLLYPDENPKTHAISIGGVWGVTLGHGILGNNGDDEDEDVNKLAKEYEKQGGDYENEPGSKNEPKKGPPERKSEAKKERET